MPYSSPCPNHAEGRTIPFALVKPPLHSRLIAWLCLALLLLTGSTPAQGLVVCIEADGCVSIEIKTTAADCTTCDGHQRNGMPEEAASDPGLNSNCPCMDCVLPGFPDERVITNRSLDLQVGPWVPLVGELLVVRPILCIASQRGPPLWAPRVAQSLAHIRSVILLL